MSTGKKTSQEGYRLPPPELVELAASPSMPVITVNPEVNTALLLEAPELKPISCLSRKKLGLAGLLIDPARRTSSANRVFYTRLSLLNLEKTPEKTTVISDNAEIHHASWSPDGDKVAFTICREDGLSLWIADTHNKKARELTGPNLNAVFGYPFHWLPDSSGLICLMASRKNGYPPPRPPSPRVLESTGEKTASRTYQYLLSNAYDEELFEYCALSTPTIVTLDGNTRPASRESLVEKAVPSPSGRYLLIESIEKPFSRLVPWSRFPRCVTLADTEGGKAVKIADVPGAESVSLWKDSVRRGPRCFEWRADKPAAIFWVEAMDDGDAGTKAEIRDRLFQLSEPFSGKPAKLADLELRFEGITWGSKNRALVEENWWRTKKKRFLNLDPGRPENGMSTLFEFSSENHYANPGRPMTRPTRSGHEVLFISRQDKIFFHGEGACPGGNRPFVKLVDPDTGKQEETWRSSANCYEQPLQLLGNSGEKLLTCRESVDIPPEYHVRKLFSDESKIFFSLPHPLPRLAGATRELIRYRREDGIELSGTLCLPPGYNRERDGALPLVMWAYPLEFRDPSAAAQVTESPHRFMRLELKLASPFFLLARGYAILYRPAMPVIAKEGHDPNDFYLEQLTANARAAVKAVIERGVADPEKIAVGGHSYGAFMTANLLAHTDLFRAGIACSGAYNRTLTPFGFQSEERTFWEAPEVYRKMSPFMYADRIKAPLLLVHGIDDENEGTFPVQSERLYGALRGNGKVARLVMLPFEGHLFEGRESVLHFMRETTDWLERHLSSRNTG